MLKAQCEAFDGRAYNPSLLRSTDGEIEARARVQATAAASLEG